MPGGGPFNTARTIGRLGGEVAFLGRLSTDRFGARLRDALDGDGVDLALTETTDAPTTLAVAELDADGGAVYRFHTGGHVRAAAVGRCGARRPRVPTPPRSTSARSASCWSRWPPRSRTRCRRSRAGTLVMLDPNCRPGRHHRPGGLPRPARRDSSPGPTSSRPAWTTSPTSRRPRRRSPPPAALVERGPALVLVTDGRRPVIAVMPDRHRSRSPSPAVAVVDTVGAGDAFGGAFLARWVELGLGRAALADPDRRRRGGPARRRGGRRHLQSRRRRSAAPRRARLAPAPARRSLGCRS